MVEYDVKYGYPLKTYRVKARSMLAAGWIFSRNLPPGAQPGLAVQFVSRAGHNAWLEWEGLISVKHRTVRVKVTYEAMGELHTETLTMRADSQDEATKVLRKGVKSLKQIEFLDASGKALTEEEEDELDSFIARWNGE